MKRQLHIRPTENGWSVVEQHPTDGMRGLCGKEWSFESTAALVRELSAILEPSAEDHFGHMAISPAGQPKPV